MVASCPAGMEQKVETLTGMFNVHVICDHVLFEIPKPMLNRDMLVNTEFAALSTGSDFVAPGSVVDNRVVRWVRRGNKIHLEDVRYEIWAPEHAQPAARRGIGVTAHRHPGVRHHHRGPDGAPVIDITELFVTEVPEGFALEFMQHFSMDRVDPKRSFIESRQGLSRTTSTSASTRPGFPIATGCASRRRTEKSA